MSERSGRYAYIIKSDSLSSDFASGRSAPYEDFAVGQFGVDLFFVISGFVIVYASERLFGKNGAGVIFLYGVGLGSRRFIGSRP